MHSFESGALFSSGAVLSKVYSFISHELLSKLRSRREFQARTAEKR
jgi:hypothetical protein